MERWKRKLLGSKSSRSRRDWLLYGAILSFLVLTCGYMVGYSTARSRELPTKHLISNNSAWRKTLQREASTIATSGAKPSHEYHGVATVLANDTRVSYPNMPGTQTGNTKLKLNDYQQLQVTCSSLDPMRVNIQSERGKLHLKTPVFLEHYKNPCWEEPFPSSDPYSSSHPYYREMQQYFQKMSKRWMADVGDGKKGTTKVRCVPYFYIIGQSKSGTTDLWNLLLLHPNITSGADKEYFWWNLRRVGLSVVSGGPVKAPDGRWASFQDYVTLFDEAAHFISKRAKNDVHHIITDASPSYLWHQDAWPAYPGNEDLKQPRYLTAHHIRDITPRAKFIILLRNPVDRLYSDYLFVRGVSQGLKTSPEEFDQQVVTGVERITSCMTSQRDIRECVYDTCLHSDISLRLRVGFYDVYVRDWVNVFDRTHFKILRTEDYSKDRASTVNEVAKFLQIGPFSNNILEQLEEMPVFNKRRAREREQGDMLPETRQLLEEFYKPFTDGLAQLLNDSNFLLENWQTSHDVPVI